MRKAGIFELVFLGLALTILSAGRGWAQTFTASIVGTITDKKGGMLHGVTVAAENIETGSGTTRI